MGVDVRKGGGEGKKGGRDLDSHGELRRCEQPGSGGDCRVQPVRLQGDTDYQCEARESMLKKDRLHRDPVQRAEDLDDAGQREEKKLEAPVVKG